MSAELLDNGAKSSSEGSPNAVVGSSDDVGVDDGGDVGADVGVNAGSIPNRWVSSVDAGT